MKISFNPCRRVLGAIALLGVCLLALAQTSEAKPPNDKHHKAHRSEHDRLAYFSHPRSGFTVTFGLGYAGRGYYYGPPNADYYYERPNVRYYASRAAVPREYFGRGSYSGNSTALAVQSALARSGYYRGTIDGQIGPQTRQAIASYQQAHGLRVTGYITNSLLRSLGL
jgi:hypothetical protein